MSSAVADHDLLEAGAREAAEALLRLSGRESARILSAGDEAVAAVSARVGAHAVVVGFTTCGALEGRLALALSEADARALAAAMTRTRAGAAAGEKLGKRALAALTELGNIAASAFMNGAAELLHDRCVPSVPALGVGDAALLLPDALGGAARALVARVQIGEVHVEVALTR